MNIKQLKADYQLAELRLKSDESEKNQTIFKQAKNAYESALKSVKAEPATTEDTTPVVPAAEPAKTATLPKTEKSKIEPLSGETQKSVTTASTEQNGDASAETNQLPATTETSGDTGSEKEKKTEVNP